MVRSSVAGQIRDIDWMGLWERYALPKGLPLLLGMLLGAVLAYSIVGEEWAQVFILPLLVPVAILILSYPFVAIIFWLLLVPFVAQAPSFIRPLFWVLHRAMIPATLGLFLLSSALGVKKRKPVRLGRVELAMFAFLGVALVSILQLQPDVPTSITALYDRTFVPFCAYLLIRLTAPGEKDLKRLVPVVLFVLIAELAVSILSLFAPQMVPSWWLTRTGRTTGTLANPAAYTTTLMFLGVFLFQAAMSRPRGMGRGWVRLLLLLASGLAAIGILLSFSRGSWLAGSLIILGLLFLYPKQMIRMVVVGVVIVVILGGSFLADQLDWASERLGQETYSGRIVVYNAMITMVRHKPFFGWGYDNLDRYDQQFHTRVGEFTIGRSDETSHNTYLTIMSELGLIGFFLYAFPFWYWFRRSIRVVRRLPREGFWSRRLLVMLWLAIGGHVVAASFMDMRNFPFSLTLWWMTLGFVASMVYPYLNRDETGGLQSARQTIEIGQAADDDQGNHVDTKEPRVSGPDHV
jgi:O-antigen ligase